MKKLPVILALFAAAVVAYAQTVAGLMPMPQQFFDGSGRPLAGGSVDTFASGTTSRLATFADSTGAVQNQNPVVLGPDGRASIWLGSSSYRIVVKAATGIVLLDMSGVTAPTLVSSDVVVPSGKSLTLASGSTTSLGASLLPTGTVNLGSGSAHWGAAYVNFLNLYSSLSLGANNTYDSGAAATAWKNTYAYGGYVNKQYLCGTPGTLSTSCWSINPTIDANNSFVAMKDEAGTEVFRWSKKEGSATTNTITFPVGWNAKVPGIVTTGMLNLSGIAHINTGSLSGDLNGTISLSSSATGAHTFATAYAFAPNCTVTPSSDPGALTYWVTTTTGAVTVHLSAPGTLTFSYLCLSGN
jgi:hypothetical protein